MQQPWKKQIRKYFSYLHYEINICGLIEVCQNLIFISRKNCEIFNIKFLKSLIFVTLDYQFRAFSTSATISFALRSALMTKALCFSATGLVFSFHTFNRFSIALASSSKLPLELNRPTATSSGISKQITAVGGPISFTNSFAWASSKGYPSIKKPSLPAADLTIASAMTSFTIPFGTASPFAISLYKFPPLCDPDMTSCLKRSPELKCLYLYFKASFSHWVPRPLPGPPIIQMIFFPCNGSLLMVCRSIPGIVDLTKFQKKFLQMICLGMMFP